MDDCDFMYIRNRPKQDPKALARARQSVILERSAGQSQSSLTPPPALQPYTALHAGDRLPLSRLSAARIIKPSLRPLRRGRRRARSPCPCPRGHFREWNSSGGQGVIPGETNWDGGGGGRRVSDPTMNLLAPTHELQGAPIRYTTSHSFLEVTSAGGEEEELLSTWESARGGQEERE
ncbi:unnamed protein product [Boreogadus saida]